MKMTGERNFTNRCRRLGRYHSRFLGSVFLIAILTPGESRTFIGRRVITAAAIFGNSREEEAKDPDPPKPPPLPPGRPPVPTLHFNAESRNQNTAILNRTPPPQPPKTEVKKSTNNETPAEMQDPPKTEWSQPPGPHPPGLANDYAWMQGHSDGNQWSGGWGAEAQYAQEQQYPVYSGDASYDQLQHSWPTLEEQLRDSLAREHDLFGQIQNLTASITALEQQDQRHIRQLDVLTERIVESEAQLAMERNNVLEYQANCTEFSRQLAVLHQELDDWQNRCAEFADLQAKSEARIKELKRNLKEARAEAENLAISIENSRIRDHMDDSKRKKKSRGILGWLWSFIVSPAEPEMGEDDQDPQVSIHC
jgi:peptidoglycan hydrolase CwlO-like protein